MSYQLKKLEYADFLQLCADAKKSPESGDFALAWNDGRIFKGFATDGRNYLSRVPEVVQEHILDLSYLFRFEGRTYEILIPQQGSVGVVLNGSDLSADERRRVADQLMEVFSVNGYFGRGARDAIGELLIEWA